MQDNSHTLTYISISSFCQQDEDHDPAEEYEEYLACAICGDHGACTLASRVVSSRWTRFFMFAMLIYILQPIDIAREAKV
jgi:hypothetical protein